MYCKMYCKMDLDNLIQKFIAKINLMSKDELDLFLKKADLKTNLSKEEVIATFKAKVDRYKREIKSFEHQVRPLLETIGRLWSELEDLDVESTSKITKTKE